MVAFLLIDSAGRDEDAVGPEDDAFVPGAAGEGGALFDECAAEAESASGGIYEQEAQARRSDGVGFGIADEEDTAKALAVAFGDPATFVFGIKLIDEVGGDAGDEGFEVLIPAVLLGVEGAMAFDHPSHIAGVMRAQHDTTVLCGFRTRHSLYYRWPQQGHVSSLERSAEIGKQQRKKREPTPSIFARRPSKELPGGRRSRLLFMVL